LNDRSSYFLKKTSELGCCGDQLNDRMLRSIPESVLSVAGNFYEIPRTSRDPMSLSTLVAKHLNISRKNEEGLDSGWLCIGTETPGGIVPFMTHGASSLG